MDIKYNSYFDKKAYKYPDKTIRLVYIKLQMVGKRYKVLELEKVEWISKDEFNNYSFALANQIF